MTIQAFRPILTAQMMLLTAPSLAATSGVIIQGAAINKDGSFFPARAFPLTAEGANTTCQVPALSAALISIY